MEEKVNILVVDDDPSLLKTLTRILQEANFNVITAADGEEAFKLFASHNIDVLLIDIILPGISGMDILNRVKRQRPDVEVIMMTAYGDIDIAVKAVKNGAYDFLTKPFPSLEVVEMAVKKAVEHRRLIHKTKNLEIELEFRTKYGDIIGSTPSMQEVFRLIESVARSPSSILITGESGTGKELVARAIHSQSPRRKRAFVAINCSAIPETLIESELFGYVRGAFTGAVSSRPGVFEAADGGTLFLDEVAELPPITQVKLLRALQEGEIKRVGSTKIIRVDVRIIAASNMDLKLALKNKKLREDLYYRLNVISIQLPPLRERKEDIPLLAYHFLKRYAKKNSKNITKITPKAMDMLMQYFWPGNVRELENAIERAVVLATQESITPKDLPPSITGQELQETTYILTELPFRKAKQIAVRGFERNYISTLIKKTKGNISQAAKFAGLDRSNFRRIIKKCELDVSKFKR
jgi:DNA-binding NtrC family response regulator